MFPDNAYALEIPAGNMSPIRELSAPTVGIAPTVYNPKLAGSVLDALGHFGSWLIRNNYCVALFCSHISVDPEAVEKLESILTAQNATASTSPGDPLCRVHQWSAEETLAKMLEPNQRDHLPLPWRNNGASVEETSADDL